MHSNLIPARTDPGVNEDVARLFGEFDEDNQDFDEDNGVKLIEEAKADPRFVQISEDLKPLIDAYDPATWRPPADAMANHFYPWEA